MTNSYCTVIRTLLMYAFTYFSLYRKGLGPRYCGLSSFLPNSEVLADTFFSHLCLYKTSISHDHVIRNNPLKDGRKTPSWASQDREISPPGYEFQPGTWQVSSLVEIPTPRVRFPYPAGTLLRILIITFSRISH